jgi:aquaporin Z
MDSRLRTYLTEMVGTFIVVLVGAGTVCASYLPNPPVVEVSAIALATGFALAVALTVTFYVSPGCLNPAVTLMQWVFRRLETAPAFALIFFQLMGAVLAGLVLRFSFADSVLREAHLGAPYLKAPLVAPGKTAEVGALVSGTGVELFAAAVITLALFASYFDPRAPRLGGILAGLAQAAVILLGYQLTGGVGNPVLWLGPAVWARTLPVPAGGPSVADALVYVGGPVLGALAAAFVYHALILPPAKRPERHK